jgi:hypothetical protein
MMMLRRVRGVIEVGADGHSDIPYSELGALNRMDVTAASQK